MAQTSQDRNPSPDLAEDNAFFPSPYSLSQYTASKTDFDGTDYPTPYIGHKKVLMVASEIPLMSPKLLITASVRDELAETAR